MEIDNRIISNNSPPYIIAELSANHNGSISRAFESILAAKESGADAVKIQTYTADTMTIDCDREEFQVTGGLWNSYNLYDLYKEARTPYEWHKPLFDYAKKIGITIDYVEEQHGRRFAAVLIENIRLIDNYALDQNILGE